MKRDVVAIIVEQRNETAARVQQVLTGWGCWIKTRLGLHDGVLDRCAPSGLIILEMVGEDDRIAECVRKLNLIKGVQAKRVRLELPAEGEAGA